MLVQGACINGLFNCSVCHNPGWIYDSYALGLRAGAYCRLIHFTCILCCVRSYCSPTILACPIFSQPSHACSRSRKRNIVTHWNEARLKDVWWYASNERSLKLQIKDLRWDWSLEVCKLKHAGEENENFWQPIQDEQLIVADGEGSKCLKRRSIKRKRLIAVCCV